MKEAQKNIGQRPRSPCIPIQSPRPSLYTMTTVCPSLASFLGRGGDRLSRRTDWLQIFLVKGSRGERSERKPPARCLQRKSAEGRFRRRSRKLIRNSGALRLHLFLLRCRPCKTKTVVAVPGGRAVVVPVGSARNGRAVVPVAPTKDAGGGR